ncbi:MAG: SDR family oxidoreductase [Saccharofermentanales bacterium]
MGILSKFELTGKKAVVTGSARGIGQAVAIALAEAGADVALIDQNSSAETEELIKEIGRDVFSFQANVADPGQVADTFAKIEERFGRVDILFNNAGIAIPVPAEEMSFEVWREVLSVNLDASFLVAQAAGKIMIKHGGGSIVNTASMSATIVNYPQPQVNYNASKAGVVHMTKSLACEWAQYNIRVNSISPGYVGSIMSLREPEERKVIWLDRTPMKRMCEPEELQGLVVFLASEASSFMTGSDVIIDGGYSCY